MQMHKIPDEILLRIFTVLVDNVESLVNVGQVNKRFHRLIDDPKLWFNAFLSRYPVWGSRVEYAFNSKKLIDWKDFMIHLVKQQKATKNFSFEFVQEQLVKSRKRRRFVQEEETSSKETPFWIQDPLVVDIDRIDKTGIVATGKHRKHTLSRTSQHKILFWEYPSWKLIRTFELNLTPSSITCQIIGIQSIRMPTADGKGNQKVRFFTLAVGIAFLNGLEHHHHQQQQQQQQQQQHNPDDFEDRVDIWKSIFVYRLFDDGSTQCVANVKVEQLFLGREVFFFSDTSWCQSNDGECNTVDKHTSNLKDWMKIVCPTHSPDGSWFTVYMMAIGPIFERNITGCVQLAKFDIRGQSNILDPSTTPVIWDTMSNQLISAPVPKYYQSFLGFDHSNTNVGPPFENATEMLTCIPLGTDVCCMIHFKYPPYLNHLICTGSYQDDELSVYDWRFGIKVGSLPWKTTPDATMARRTTSITRAVHVDDNNNNNNNILPQLDLNRQRIQQPEEEDEEDDDADTVEIPVDVRPWGLESTLVLPPYWMPSDREEPVEYSRDHLAQHGFRLIAVGDNRSDNHRDKLEIKVWDISYLLQVKWDPLSDNNQQAAEENISDSLLLELTERFAWWPRRTKELSRLAIQMVLKQQHQSQLSLQHEFSFDLNNNLQHNANLHLLYTNKKTHSQQFTLPYSPPKGFQSLLLSHTFDKDEEQQPEDIPVKYTAYNVLYTSLFLLTEDGKITVMDIETGKISGTVNNVAHVEGKRGSPDTTQQVRGIDVNVIGGREVVVTSKEGLLRGVVF